MRRATAGLAAIAILLLAACSASGESDAAEWGPLAVWRSDDFGQQALLAPEGGILEIGDECVLVEHEGGTTALAWPSGMTEWHEDPATIVFRGQELRDGDVLSFGGSSEGAEPDWIQEPNAGCPDGRWFVSSVELMEEVAEGSA